MDRYQRYYMRIADLKTEAFGLGCIAPEDHVEVAGKIVVIQTRTMKHLGAILPLKDHVHLTKKAASKIDSVRQLWSLETDIPFQVCVEQFHGEVLGTLRHQQQVARLPTKAATSLQDAFEAELRRILVLGQAPPGEYLRAPRPAGLGLGSIELEGAVDFLMGLGQFRWAPKEQRAEVLSANDPPDVAGLSRRHDGGRLIRARYAQWHRRKDEAMKWLWRPARSGATRVLAAMYARWRKALTATIEDATHVSDILTKPEIWDAEFRAQQGPGKRHLWIPRLKVPQERGGGSAVGAAEAGGQSADPMRRVYPHFVRSAEKTKLASVGGMRVALASRRWKWMDEHLQRIVYKEEEQQEKDAPNLPKSRRVLYLHPQEEACESMAQAWSDGDLELIAVVMVAGELELMGPPGLRIQISESEIGKKHAAKSMAGEGERSSAKDGDSRFTEVLFTEREVSTENSLPRK
eukprot:gene6862-286_t